MRKNSLYNMTKNRHMTGFKLGGFFIRHEKKPVEPCAWERKMTRAEEWTNDAEKQKGREDEKTLESARFFCGTMPEWEKKEKQKN